MEKQRNVREIGARIAQIRAQLGLTQREFAARIDVSQGLVAQWESHRKPPGARALKRIANETGISMDAISQGPLPSARSLWLTDDDEIKLIGLYRRLPGGTKKNVLELVEMAINIGRIQQKKRSPLQIE